MENNKRIRTEIIGYVKDARYRNMREPIRHTVYVPVNSADEEKGGLRPEGLGNLHRPQRGRQSPFPYSHAAEQVKQARAGFRVVNVNTQTELVQRHTLRRTPVSDALHVFRRSRPASGKRRSLRRP